MLTAGTWKWPKVRGESTFVIRVEVIPDLDHIPPFPPVQQCWKIEHFQSLCVGHVLRPINKLCCTDLDVLQHSDMFSKMGGPDRVRVFNVGSNKGSVEHLEGIPVEIAECSPNQAHHIKWCHTIDAGLHD